MAEFNGSIFLAGTKLSVVNKKTGNIRHLAVEKFNETNKEGNYKSFYLGKHSNDGFQVEEVGPPKYIYTFELADDQIFKCGSNSKLMISRNQFSSRELLPVEYIYSDYDDIEFAIIDEKEALAGRLNKYSLGVKSIKREENEGQKGYVIVFDNTASSVLTLIKGGIIVRGEKGVNISI